MHGMLKRAAAAVIPALLGLAVSPASAMAAPHTSRAVAGPVKGSRETHQGRRAGATSTAETTADTYRSAGTGAGFAATPAIPVILAFPPTFTAIPAYPGGIARLARFPRVPISVIGGSAQGIDIINGKNVKLTGNDAVAGGASGIDISQGNVTGSGSNTAVGSAGR
jgi:hypothetical protein